MMKKILALVLVLTLALGALAVTATADNADVVDYRVGYGKTDLNPYWGAWVDAGNTIPTQAKTSTGANVTKDHIMPLPMGGYGGNIHRLSRPELVDDTGTGDGGDGYVYLANNRYTQAFAKEMLGEDTDAYKAYAAEGFGENDGDGIYVTCVSIQQNEDAAPILMFSVDLISVGESYCGQAKNVIIQELKKIGVDITPDRILINATHTHGAVSLGESFTNTEKYAQKLYGNTTSVEFTGKELASYLSFFRTHLYNQLAAAAVKALTEGQTNGAVTMSKGTIDVSEATGYQMNGVRHKQAKKTVTLDGKSQEVQYVTGSSFNVFSGDTEFDTVSDSNDLMHVLQFAFPENSNVEPILVINWRAHTTANNKMGSKAYNNLSADFVAAMRWKLEQWGYRPILNYGTSGNLGMGDTPTTYNMSLPDNPAEPNMTANEYGYDLAFAAAFLVNSSQTEVQTYKTNRVAEIKDKRGSYSLNATSSYQIWNTVYNNLRKFTSPGMTVCEQGKILLESTYFDVKPQTSSDAEYQAALYHDALAKKEGGSATDDGGLKLKVSGYPYLVTQDSAPVVLIDETTDAEGVTTTTTTTVTFSSKTVEKVITKDGVLYGEQPEATVTEYAAKTGTVVLASQYHSNNLKSRHGTLNAKRISLTAYTLGEKVAFVTVPFEASDRYSMEAVLTTANNYNDWDNLINNEKWGTPFVTSLTNGSEGYIPNNLAYTYKGVVGGVDYDLQGAYIKGLTSKFVNGCYEAHIAYAKAGQGEEIVATLNNLLRGLEDGQAEPNLKTGYCEDCKTTATWVPLNNKVVEDCGSYLPTGHYYLEENFENVYGQMVVRNGETVCVDLNGKTLHTKTNTGASRVFLAYGVLNIQDSVGGGILKGRTASGQVGATLYSSTNGVINLYSGTVTAEIINSAKSDAGGVVYVISEFNIYGGTITGGYATNGGNVAVTSAGVVNMYGGIITGGTAAQGGNVYTTATTKDGVLQKGTFNLYSGSITGGTGSNYGGNVQAQGGNFSMYGGTIADGKGGTGKNLLVSQNSPAAGTFRFAGGYIDGGEGTSRTTHIMGNLILGGTATERSSQVTNLYVANNVFTVSLDGTFTGKVKVAYSIGSSHTGGYSTSLGGKVGTATAGSSIHPEGGLMQVGNYYAYVDANNILRLTDTMPTYVAKWLVNGGYTYFTGFEAAFAVNSTAQNPVVLLDNVDTLTVTKNAYLDLNGYTVSNVVAGAKKLYVSDSATADFDVADGQYGRIADVKGVVAAPSHLAVKENGMVSFHKYEMELTELVVNPEQKGITYKSNFKCNEMMQAQIKEFGIAMRAYNAPNETSIWSDPDCKTHVALTKEQWTNNAVKSVYVSNIIDPTLDAATNQARAQVGIFGRAYMVLEDGTMIFGSAQSFSMQSAMEHVDSWWNILSDANKADLVSFYTDPAYMSFMETWNIPNIKAAAK